MAERNADNPDVIIDEVKRKARRRLVGAVVLALAAAIVVPMLLEKEPRPLGDDVSVQIPPVDEGRFINRLTGKGSETKTLPKSDGKAGGTAAAKSEPRAEAPPAPDSRSEPNAAPAAEAKAAPTTEPAATDAKPTALASAATSPAKAEGFVVQLAAFADDKGANALANKLKKAGHPAFVQPVETSRGTLWRVRVGGYASRPEADAVRMALKDEGHSGIVVPAQ